MFVSNMTCYSLAPPDGKDWLEPIDVARRLSEEFAICDVSPEAGIEHAQTLVERLRAANAPPEIVAHIAIGAERTVAIGLADEEPDPDDENFLVLNVIPEESIKIYTVEKLLPLVSRCANVLGYTMTELQ